MTSTALFDIAGLSPLIQAGELILTPNNRLRNHIRKAYFAAAGAEAIPMPTVFSLTEWLEQRWHALAATGNPLAQVPVISDFQRIALWSRIVAEAHPKATGSARQLVSQADEAYRNLQRWRLTLNQLAPELRDEFGNPSPFFLWASRFEAALSDQGMITRESAHLRLGQASAEGLLAPVERIYLESFDDMSPLQEWLLEQLAKECIQAPKPELNPQHLRRTSAPDQEQELRSAATWAWEVLQAEPEARIGIIVPSLGQDRDTVERIFTETFEAHSYDPAAPRYTLPFNISTGSPLGSTPVVDAALQLLRLNQEQIPAELAYRLLHSPFFSDARGEWWLRAETTARLKADARTEIRVAALRSEIHRLAERRPTPNHLQLSQRLQQFQDHHRRHGGVASAEVWARRFVEQLEILGWPGSRSLDSVEYQQVSQWHLLLDQFASLDALNLGFGFSEALALLNQLAGRTHFQAELKDSPIHILGILEGAGLRFSHCWLLGMDNNQWPAKPNPNPLLPFRLQRELRMPRASLERELAYAHKITANYLHCAGDIVISHYQQRDEGEQMPSALFEKIEYQPIETITKSLQNPLHTFALKLVHDQKLEWVDCQKGPSLVLAKNEFVRGGSGVLKAQANCPFNAFAEIRLGARAPEAPYLGLSPLEKGNLMHAALALVWGELKTQSALLALDDEQQGALVERIVAAVFEQSDKRHLHELGDHYYQLEQQRMCKLLLQWLEVEKQRPPFEVIGIESALEAEFGGLYFRLRIDRVDRLADDSVLLIDYKTGQPKVSQWFGPRPDEPQLPLYTLCSPFPSSGIAFGVIHARSVGIDGVSGSAQAKLREPAKVAGVEDWPALVQEFRQHLSALSTEFLSGDARVMMKTSKQNFADQLQPLNRIGEANYIGFLRLEQREGEAR